MPYNTPIYIYIFLFQLEIEILLKSQDRQDWGFIGLNGF